MKKILLGTVAVIALGISLGLAPAMAADMPVRGPARPAPSYVAPIYNWTGFYLGGHLGFGFGGDDDDFGIVGLTSDSSDGFLAGGQIGFDFQVAPNWVLGVEGQLSWVDFNRTWSTPLFAVTHNNDWLGSVTGRIGYTWGPGLLYVKGGVAFTDNEYALAFAGVPGVFTSANNSNTGWTLGAGLEYLFAPSWSAKLEYQYYSFDDTTFTAAAPFPAAGFSVDHDIHTIKLGVNYRFNWGGPVVAKY